MEMRVLPRLEGRHHLPRWLRPHLQTAVFMGPALQYANIRSVVVAGVTVPCPV